MTIAQDQELSRIIKRRGKHAGAVLLRVAKEVMQRRASPMRDVTDEELITEAQSRDLVVPPR